MENVTPYSGGKLDGEIGPQGRLLCSPNSSRPPEMALFSMAGPTVSVPVPSLQAVISSLHC